MLQITFANRFALRNRAIKNRLSESGLVAFVMSQAAIAIDVYDHVTLKLVTKIERQPHDLRHRFRVLTVDVEDRNLKHLADVARISARAGLLRPGRKPNLVVD